MKPRWSWLVLAVAGVALGVAASWFRDRSVAVAAAPGISLRERSRLLGGGRFEPGRSVKSGKLAARVAADASSALAAIPSELRPALVLIDVEPRYADAVPEVALLEYHRVAQSIVVGASGVNASQSVWLHELAHARLAGSRPKGPLAQRLVDAIEEGVADYFAAAIAGNSVVGAREVERDLRRPPRVGPSEWASLALSGFDTHRMGWLLAARLYERDPQGGSLLRDAVACLDGESALGGASESPAAVLDAFLSACPAAGRSRLARVLSEWLPLELISPEIPT